jgi:hypothetical protein
MPLATSSQVGSRCSLFAGYRPSLLLRSLDLYLEMKEEKIISCEMIVGTDAWFLCARKNSSKGQENQCHPPSAGEKQGTDISFTLLLLETSKAAWPYFHIVTDHHLPFTDTTMKYLA